MKTRATVFDQPLAPLTLAAADLAVGARGALVVAMMAGAVLLLFGARLVRPSVVLAAMFAGFVGAIVTARAFAPGVPLWAAAAVGAIAGLIAGALLYRPAVAMAAALLGATIGGLVAFAVMSGGGLDTAPRELGHALVASPREAARPGEGQRAGIRMLEVLTIDDDPSAAATPGDAPAGDRMLRSAATVAHRAADRVHAAYEGTAPAFRTLLTGSLVAGAVAGLIAGLVATTLVARVITSLAGAWLLLVGIVPLLASRGAEPLPPDARAWLVVLAVLTVAGTIAQGALAGPGTAPRRARARRDEPDATPAAAG